MKIEPNRRVWTRVPILALKGAWLGAALLLGIMLMISTGCGYSERAVSADPVSRQAAEDGAEAGPTPAPAHRAPAVVPREVTISVRLLHAISSRSVAPGDLFDAELAAPVQIDDQVLFPRGARVRGRIVSARASGRLQDPGYLELTLAAVQSPDGYWVNLATTSISASGKGHRRRNTTLIGGGAGLGALIGGIAGGGKGAAIGAGIGAGSGTAGALATGRSDVSFSAERMLTFRTSRETPLRP